MEPEPPERHFNIQIEPQALAGVYANFANVSHSDYEFTITFARVDHDVEGPEVPGRRRRARQPLAALHAPADRRAAGQLLEVVDPPGHQAAAGVRRRRRPRRRVARRLLRVAVISDVHSNLQALEAVLEHADREGIDELWCLGDVVGYGGRPSECLALVRERAAICLGGNHDLVVSGVLDIDQFTSDAGVAARWTRSVLTPDELEVLAVLSPKGERAGVSLFHGSIRDPVWEYVLTADVADAALRVQTTDLALVGPQPRAALARARRDRARGRQGRARSGDEARGARNSSTPDRSASRATATRARPGCCSTREAAWARFMRSDVRDRAGAGGHPRGRAAGAPRRPPLARALAS